MLVEDDERAAWARLSEQLGQTLSAASGFQRLAPEPEPPALMTLPLELQHRVLSTAGLNAAARLGKVCSALRGALSTLPASDAMFRTALLGHIGFVPAVPTALENAVTGGNRVAAIDWRHACEVVLGADPLAALPPLDGHGNKYLQWVDGQRAHSARVRHTIVGLSLLPARVQDCFGLDGGLLPRVEVAVRFLFCEGMAHAEFIEAMQQGIETAPDAATRSEIRENYWRWRAAAASASDSAEATRLFNVERFLALLGWMASPQGARIGRDPLLLMLAEYDQIRCRQVARFLQQPLPFNRGRGISYGGLDAIARASLSHEWRTSNRQLGSFCQLVRLANCDPAAEAGYWI